MAFLPGILTPELQMVDQVLYRGEGEGTANPTARLLHHLLLSGWEAGLLFLSVSFLVSSVKAPKKP